MYEEIQKTENSTPHPTDLAPEHGMVFKTADETELADFWVLGTLPEPEVGKVIHLHWQQVKVTAVNTHYGRDEGSGRPLVFTTVTVEAHSSPAGTEAVSG
ncbi:hypothetical protein [Streptomyces olivaceus]|uniref:hypothetical protein n=1 Tax=Streptomyces olivaceus TaxID=47716 RepID=UPI001CC93447|nr:hypothetical protein [Streptomyces olivaceus]